LEMLRELVAEQGPGEGAQQCGGQGSGKEVEPGAGFGVGEDQQGCDGDRGAGEEEREFGDGRHTGGMPHPAPRKRGDFRVGIRENAQVPVPARGWDVLVKLGRKGSSGPAARRCPRCEEDHAAWGCHAALLAK
jgi:hypothetical protein